MAAIKFSGFSQREEQLLLLRSRALVQLIQLQTAVTSGERPVGKCRQDVSGANRRMTSLNWGNKSINGGLMDSIIGFSGRDGGRGTYSLSGYLSYLSCWTESGALESCVVLERSQRLCFQSAEFQSALTWQTFIIIIFYWRWEDKVIVAQDVFIIWHLKVWNCNHSTAQLKT